MSQLDYLMPSEALRTYFSVYYLFQTDADYFSDGERAGIAQLRFVFCGSGKLHFSNGTSTTCSGAMILGPTTGAMQFEIQGPFRMFGIGILPPGWDALTGASAADFTDRVIPAITLFPRIDERLAALQRMTSLAEMAEAAEALLLPTVEQASPETIAFARMVDDWLASDPSPDVCDLHRRSQLSERQLTRRVKHLYGMPPKYLSRKYRALRAARAMMEGDPEYADLLRDSFYDQSHMIRELKLFAGTTPHKLLGDRDGLSRLINKRGRFMGKISALTAET